MKTRGVEQYEVADPAIMRELVQQDDVNLSTDTASKDQLFCMIKNSTYQTYRGSWGDEPIYWDGETAAFTESIHERSIEIRAWINDRLFGEHNL